MNNYEGLYNSESFCLKEIQTARQLFSNKTTTEAQYDALEKGLGLVYLYCPESLQSVALATLQEAEKRRFYFELLWRN